MNLIRATLLAVVLSVYFGLEVQCYQIEVQSLLVWGQKPSKTLGSYAASRDMMLMYNNRYLSIFLTLAIDCIMIMIIIVIIISITHLVFWSCIYLSTYIYIYIYTVVDKKWSMNIMWSTLIRVSKLRRGNIFTGRQWFAHLLVISCVNARA
jgi:hypothetical protein